MISIKNVETEDVPECPEVRDVEEKDLVDIFSNLSTNERFENMYDAFFLEGR
jgi:hypothetical protein